MSEGETENLLNEAFHALEDNYVPALKKLISAIESTEDDFLEPQGVWNQPNGDEYYLHSLKKYTTTDMKPEEIHALGLSEVKRIRDLMITNLKSLGYEDELVEMMEKRLTDIFHEKDLPATSPDIRSGVVHNL